LINNSQTVNHQTTLQNEHTWYTTSSTQAAQADIWSYV